MARNEWYDWFTSPYLQKLYATVSNPGREQFIERIMNLVKPAPGSELLEAGCGWGETTRILAGYGFETTGTDLSDISITAAKEFETANLHFYLHDLRLPFWSNYYHLAFNLYSNFGFYDTRREHSNALRTIAGSLRPEGIFVFDYFNTGYYEAYPVYDDQQVVDGITYTMSRWNDATHFHSSIIVGDPAVNEPLHFKQRKVKFTLGDITQLLNLHGLHVEHVFGDYELGAYDPVRTPRLIVIARKTEYDGGDKEKRLYSDGRTTDALT